MKQNIIIVTGSSGHLGEALMRVMKQRNIKCVGIDIQASEFTSHVGSISDKAFVRSIIQKYEDDENLSQQVIGIINTAVLHKPHIVSHSMQDFIDVNVTGTLTLLDAFSEICCNNNKNEKKENNDSTSSANRFFIQTSTTSTYGDSLISKDKSTITWIDETVAPSPKNIYGVTKKSGEEICQLFAKQNKIPNVFVLQASRFFPEEDDDQKRAATFVSNFHAQFIELLNRRVEIEDLVDVHLLAAQKAMSRTKSESHTNTGVFKRYICSAPSPFSLKKDPNILPKLAAKPLTEILKEEQFFPELWKKLEQEFPDSFGKPLPVGVVDRVYCSEAAQEDLGWKPKYTFEGVLKSLLKSSSSDKDFDGNWKSDLAAAIGLKGYHEK